MTSRKRYTPRKLKTSIKIHIICEGDTEYYYLQDVLKEYSKTVTIESISGGGYSKYIGYIEKNAIICDVILIVADLDKAQNGESNLHYLNELIVKLARLDKRNAVFLTAPEIEYWISCCIGRPEMYANLKTLGYEKGEKVNAFIRSYKGSHRKGINYVSRFNRLYYEKRDPKKTYSINRDNLYNNQSNLEYLLEYIDLINK